jgi:hypothetical protein
MTGVAVGCSRRKFSKVDRAANSVTQTCGNGIRTLLDVVPACSQRRNASANASTRQGANFQLDALPSRGCSSPSIEHVFPRKTPNRPPREIFYRRSVLQLGQLQLSDIGSCLRCSANFKLGSGPSAFPEGFPMQAMLATIGKRHSRPGLLRCALVVADELRRRNRPSSALKEGARSSTVRRDPAMVREIRPAHSQLSNPGVELDRSAVVLAQGRSGPDGWAYFPTRDRLAASTDHLATIAAFEDYL